MIRPATRADAGAIVQICDHYVANSSITFETDAASVRLHEKLGFVKVAQSKEVGFKFDRWIDVGYWELLLR